MEQSAVHGFNARCVGAGRSRQQGNVLLTSLVVLAIIGTMVAYSLSRVQTVTRLSARSQDWNACIGLAEAGVEEGLAHLQLNYSNRVSQGWTFSGGRYGLRRTLGSDYFQVNIVSNASTSTSTRFTNRVTSTGCIYLPSTATFLCRTVAVDMVATVSPPTGLIARDGITMNGNPAGMDSYDSRDPTKSTGGAYVVAKRQANALIGCVNGNFNIGNADVYGKVMEGPGVTGFNTSPNCSVGNAAWVNAGTKGIQPGAKVANPNLAAPDVTKPFSSAPAPPAMTIGGINYAAVLDDGNYKLPFIWGGRILVRGKAVLYVEDYVWMTSGTQPLQLAPGATLDLYVGGTHVTINTVQMNAGTGNMLGIYGLPSVTSVSVPTGPSAPVYINAPNADFTMSGNSHFYGAIVCKTFKSSGTPSFHYDEAIGGYLSTPKFQLLAWMEP